VSVAVAGVVPEAESVLGVVFVAVVVVVPDDVLESIDGVGIDPINVEKSTEISGFGIPPKKFLINPIGESSSGAFSLALASVALFASSFCSASFSFSFSFSF